ncbi:MAG: hypothetical protein LIO76_07090 [Clostridiales bacterium]|nr:hypothetical protein [Clostridiales bacterium]
MKQAENVPSFSKEEILSLPPEQRPATGEVVIIAESGGFGQIRGIVKAKRQKKSKYSNPHAVRYLVEAKIPGCTALQTFECTRDVLRDESGKPFAPIITEEEARWKSERKTSQAAQARRLEEAVYASKSTTGHVRDFESFCRIEGGMHGNEIEELLEGEVPVSEFFDGDYLGDILGVGYDWIIEGDDRCREYPLAGDMKEFLKYHPDKRELVWKWMQEEKREYTNGSKTVSRTDKNIIKENIMTEEYHRPKAADQSRNDSIKFLVMDVDGTLTDGKIYMGPGGEMMKAFDIKDGCGIKDIAIPAGIIPVIITARESAILMNRCKEIGITHIYQGIRDKINKLNEITKDLSMVAYIGDDILDLQCMKPVKAAGGLVGCPMDAVEKVKEVSDFVSGKKGGCGAVREFIEWIVNRDNAERQ